MSLLGSLHFLGGLDMAANWGMALGSARIGVAWTPSEVCDIGAL